jgi:prepilin-type N-terminal cleavage/methylation domain-containing protein
MKRRGDGFTLLEVLIAISILVLGVASILPLYAVGSASHRRGMDQAQVAWLAPRIAARLQERLVDLNPKDVQGYVKLLEDGGILVDDADGRLAQDPAAAYSFRASFEPMMSVGDVRDPMPGAAFLLRVELRWRDGQELLEKYETVVLRKLLR